MAKYIVEQDPKTRKTRVRRVEELRPGQGVVPASVRRLPMERRAKFAGILSWWSAARTDFRERVESRRLTGMVLFMALVYGLPLIAVMLHVMSSSGGVPLMDDATLGGVVGVCAVGLVCVCVYKLRPHTKRR